MRHLRSPVHPHRCRTSHIKIKTLPSLNNFSMYLAMISCRPLRLTYEQEPNVNMMRIKIRQYKKYQGLLCSLVYISNSNDTHERVYRDRTKPDLQSLLHAPTFTPPHFCCASLERAAKRGASEIVSSPKASVDNAAVATGASPMIVRMLRLDCI